MNLKMLFEKKAAKQAEMKAIIETANTEERALNADEQKKFADLEAEIGDIVATIEAMEKARKFEQNEPAGEDNEGGEDENEESETRAFEAYIRGEESRADVQLTKGDNGAVVPTSIANKIIEKVVEMCPIYHDADRYNVTGTLQIPYYDDSTGDISVGYADEFTDGESTSGKFKNISLGGFLARALTDVSKSLINNSQFNVVDFVINRMARNIALFLERELLHGTDGKVAGLSGITQIVTAESSTAITSDEIIDLQEEIPDMYSADAYFIMHKKTRTAIRKLKDGDGNYLLNKDANSRWGYTLFGKDVYTSDAMDQIGAGKTAIIYGDMKGLACKVSEEINIEVLRETKARQHAVEVLGFVEFDAKVQDAQKLAKLVMKA